MDPYSNARCMLFIMTQTVEPTVVNTVTESIWFTNVEFAKLEVRDRMSDIDPNANAEFVGQTRWEVEEPAQEPHSLPRTRVHFTIHPVPCILSVSERGRTDEYWETVPDPNVEHVLTELKKQGRGKVFFGEVTQT